MCLGQNDKIDFKSILRSKDYNKLDDAINLAMRIKKSMNFQFYQK